MRKDTQAQPLVERRTKTTMISKSFFENKHGFVYDSKRDRQETMEMWPWTIIIGTTWVEHKTNKSVFDEVNEKR